MKLKKSLYTLIATGSMLGLAHADIALVQNDKGELDFYSVLDAAVVNQNHSLSISPTMPNQIYPFQKAPLGCYTGGANCGNQAPGSVTGLLGGGLSDSRVGFKGFRNLDNGIKAIFDLESGFDLTSGQLNNAAGAVAANPTGLNKQPNVTGKPLATVSAYNTVNADSSLNGQLFGRAAWFGLQDPIYGKVTAGLQNNPMKDVFADYDPVQSDTFSPFGESGTFGGGGGVSEDARMENSVEYTNGMNGFDYSVAFQFGNNTSSNGIVGGSGVGRGSAVRFGYQNSMFGIQAVYNNFTDALKATNSPNENQINLVALNTESWLVAARFTGIEGVNLKAGWMQFINSAPSDQVNIAEIWGIQVNQVNSQSTKQKTTTYFAGGDIDLMPKVNFSLGYYDILVANGENANGTTAFGQQHISTVSAVLKYSLAKNADAYLVGSTNKFSGGGFTVNGSVPGSMQNAFGMGARIKF